MTTAAAFRPTNKPLTVRRILPPLEPGDRLSREEFLARWEEMPELKRAELIYGVVHMPSPTGVAHGDNENIFSVLLGYYAILTRGTQASNQATILLDENNIPQPDVHLRILPEFGGQSRPHGNLLAGAPEFCAEISGSSASYDLHPKRQLYQTAGVREYLVLLLWEREIRLHRLGPSGYELVPVPTEGPSAGVLRSAVFPGLWLNVPAILAGDGAAALATLQAGLASAEHTEFARALADRHQPAAQSGDAQS